MPEGGATRIAKGAGVLPHGQAGVGVVEEVHLEQVGRERDVDLSEFSQPLKIWHRRRLGIVAGAVADDPQVFVFPFIDIEGRAVGAEKVGTDRPDGETCELSRTREPCAEVGCDASVEDEHREVVLAVDAVGVERVRLAEAGGHARIGAEVEGAPHHERRRVVDRLVGWHRATVP